MSAPDPVDDLLAGLKPAQPPADLQPKAEQAFRNYAQESKKGTAGLWRTWGRYVEPVLVGIFVLVFVVWAAARLLAG